MISQRQNQRLPRGMTLIELLIVMAIIVLLAGIALPQVKSLLKDQRIGQTARVVQGFAESARARAIATGRPVALVLERARIDGGGGSGTDGLIANDTCLRMSLGEVFPPYEGDWSGSTAQLFDTNTDGYIDFMEILAAEAASLTGPNALVHVGDVVELGDRHQGFLITAIASGSSISGSNNPVVQLSLANPPFLNGRQSAEPAWPLTSAMADPTNPAKVRFRIFRAPSKMMSGSVVLPRGTCIDLSVSGVGPAGRDFGTLAINSPTGTSPTPGDYGQVYLVFSPRGNLDLIYYQARAVVSGNIVPTVVRVLPNGIYHLLVGRTEQVDPGYGTAATMSSTSGRDDFKPNLLDPANIWVSINPNSGAIYSSQVFAGPGDIPSARTLATGGLTRQGN